MNGPQDRIGGKEILQAGGFAFRAGIRAGHVKVKEGTEREFRFSKELLSLGSMEY
jgi:hypothetical protein